MDHEIKLSPESLKNAVKILSEKVERAAVDNLLNQESDKVILLVNARQLNHFIKQLFENGR